MKEFEVGQEFEVFYKAQNKYRQYAGTLEIIEINRDSTQDWKNSCIRDCYHRDAGEIVFILNTERTKGKVKKAPLFQVNNSESWAKHYTHDIREYEWFCPTKRDYICISSVDDTIE